MKTHSINIKPALLIMIYSLTTLISPRCSRSITALAFRHGHASPSCVIRHQPSDSDGGHRLFHTRSGKSTTTTFTPSFQFSKVGSISTTTTRLYHSSDATNNDNDASSSVSVGTTADRSDIDTEAQVDDDDDDKAKAGGKETWQNPRSRWAKKKHVKKMEKEMREKNRNGDADTDTSDDDTEKGGLDWEDFDFGESPKMDKRFKETKSPDLSDTTGIPKHLLNTISTESITYKSYLQSEANLDKASSDESLKSQSEFASLSPETVSKSIDILKPYVQEKRLARIDEVLNQRTRHTRFLFENPSNPSNVWACLRTLDSFGIQYVDVIVHSDSYQGKAAINQKRGMRTAMGSAMWMTIRQFGSMEEAVKHLREEEGCLIYASDLNPSAKDVRDLTWDVNVDDDKDANGDDDTKCEKEQRPICIVMGNEDQGISDEMRELADETFYLPMCGFAESFNLSVATAITLAYMSAKSRGEVDSDGVSSEVKGPLRPGDLDPHELQCLRLKGILNSIAQKRIAPAVLKKEGIVLPSSFHN